MLKKVLEKIIISKLLFFQFVCIIGEGIIDFRLIQINKAEIQN